jgi:phosphate uptake regulator
MNSLSWEKWLTGYGRDPVGKSILEISTHTKLFRNSDTEMQLEIVCAGVHEETLNHIGKRFSQGPPNAPDFKIHRAMERILKVIGSCVNSALHKVWKYPVEISSTCPHNVFIFF